jgi:hypothetical protein
MPASIIPAGPNGPYEFGFLSQLVEIHFPGVSGPTGASAAQTIFNWENYEPGGGGAAYFMYSLVKPGPSLVVDFNEVTVLEAGVTKYTGPIYGSKTQHPGVAQNAWLVSADLSIDPDAVYEDFGGGVFAYVSAWYYVQGTPGNAVSFYLQTTGINYNPPKPPSVSSSPPVFPTVPWIIGSTPNSPDGVVYLHDGGGSPPTAPDPVHYPYLAYNLFGGTLGWVNLDGGVWTP